MFNQHLIQLDPCTLSSASQVPGANSLGAPHSFTATPWTTLTPLVIVIRAAIRFITTTAIHLLPEITSVYVFTTLRPWDKWGPSPPFRTWVIMFMLFPRSMVFIWACITLLYLLYYNWAIRDPFRETDNSSISLSLIMLMIQLMIGVPRVTGTWAPKMVESSTTRATWSSS